MKKISLFLLFALTAGTLCAATFRTDISGLRPEGKVKLSPASAEGDSFKTANISWGKEEDRPYNIVAYGTPLKGDGWTSQQFTFKADEAGKVSLQFGGQWAKEAKDREWVLVADLKVDGESLPNADFAKSSMNKDRAIPNGYWIHGQGKLVPGAGPDGKGAVLVNHDNRLYYALPVEAGKTYTVTLQVKTAPAE